MMKIPKLRAGQRRSGQRKCPTFSEYYDTAVRIDAIIAINFLRKVSRSVSTSVSASATAVVGFIVMNAVPEVGVIRGLIQGM